MKTTNYLNFYMCFLIVDKPILLSGFFCVYVFYQLTTFAVLILYYFFYFVLCKRGKIKKLESLLVCLLFYTLAVKVFTLFT